MVVNAALSLGLSVSLAVNFDLSKDNRQYRETYETHTDSFAHVTALLDSFELMVSDIQFGPFFHRVHDTTTVHDTVFVIAVRETTRTFVFLAESDPLGRYTVVPLAMPFDSAFVDSILAPVGHIFNGMPWPHWRMEYNRVPVTESIK